MSFDVKILDELLNVFMTKQFMCIMSHIVLINKSPVLLLFIVTARFLTIES